MKAVNFNSGSRGLIPPPWSIGYLCLLALAVSGCFREKRPPATGEGVGDVAVRTIGRKLAHQLSASHAAVLEGDTLYLIRFNSALETAQSQSLLLGFGEESDFPDTTVVYDRMKWEAFNAGDTIPYAFLGVPLPPQAFRRIEIKLPAPAGQGTKDTFSIAVNRERLETLGFQRCDGPVSRGYRNLNQWVFRHHLTHGVFFETQREIYVLFYEKTCWVIRRKPGDGSNKFMLHFIDQDSRFDNYSFPMGPSAFEGCMEAPGGLWIARIQLQRPFDSYRKIRVGQFTGDGNIWAQTLQVSRILENELLRYTDELE
jgi:hypothetical protein